MTNNEMYDLPSNVICVIPPFCIHKFEGADYRRININISKDLLTEDEINFLDSCAEKIALRFDDEFREFVEPLLTECARLYDSNDVRMKCYELPMVKTILYFMQKEAFEAVPSISATNDKNATDMVILKIINFINENYRSRIELKALCDRYFLSKASLCARFKRVMKCSIMEYLLQIRLSKARDLLLVSDLSIEEVADSCGFSSANYFRTAFKRTLGVSPLSYRKDIRGERKNRQTAPE
nr:helix-turn-helix transcriptional regulator [Clostridia bacterium]